MNELATAVEEVRTELAGIGNEILFDLCDIYGPTFTDGGEDGDSVGKEPVATDINVTIKGFGASKQFVVGGEAYTATHELKMVRNVDTVAITPEHRIETHPRGLTGALIFENPHIDESSTAPLLTVHATLVIQGYKQ